MKAAVLHGVRDLRIEEIDKPKPGPREVLVRIEAVGICGTDVQVYRGDHPANLPIVLGHEYVGIVAELGSAVAEVRVGDRVTSGASWPCGACARCLAGAPAECTDRQALARRIDGTLAEFALLHGGSVQVMPSDVPVDWLQSASPVAGVLKALRRGGVQFGQAAAVCGAGHAGLIALQLLAWAGCRSLTMLGTRPERLDLARKLGADAAIDVRQADWLDAAKQATSSAGFDLIFEASGTQAGIDQAVKVARRGARIVAFGLYDGRLEIDAKALYARDLALIGTRGGDGFRDLALRLIADETVRIDPLVTDRCDLAGCVDAFRRLDTRQNPPIRAVVRL